MNFFQKLPVLALTSDASIDFTPADFNAPLAKAQQVYLKAQTGKEIPQVFWRKQIHGNDVVAAHGKPEDCRACPDADAFVTDQLNLPIAIRTADCVPVFIFDPVKGVIGLAHAGWKGTHAQIARHTLQTMQDKYGCKCYDLQAALGPAIRSCCYQVGPEFKEHFPQDVQERSGHLYVDLIAANRRQLLTAGVLAQNIHDSHVCTACDHNYFSYRRQGSKTGRMISLMMLI